MSHIWIIVTAFLGASLGLGACAGAPVVDDGATDAGAARVASRVRATDALYVEPIPCVIVLDPEASDGLVGDVDLAEAVARQLSARIDRVVGPAERRRLERRWSLDAGRRDDLRRLAGATECGHAVSVVEHPSAGFYVVIWTRQAVGLTLTLRRVSDDTVLWQASSETARTDGGVPLSPWSALVNAAEGGWMASDPELRASLIDDTLRRIVGTLPDFRRLGYSRDRIAQRYGMQ